MRAHSLIVAAAAPTIEVVRNTKPDQLGNPTPCREYDVRALVNHLLFWGPSLEGAARKEAVATPAAGERDTDLVGDDWAARLAEQIDRLVTAWGTPTAWEGSAPMNSAFELPAPMVGGMVLSELLVHGWDLGRATGQKPRWDDVVLEFAHQELTATAEQGREMGVYGPEMPVAADAPTLDRVLGLTGRDPHWMP